jgi:hypothetical protein
LVVMDEGRMLEHAKEIILHIWLMAHSTNKDPQTITWFFRRKN